MYHFEEKQEEEFLLPKVNGVCLFCRAAVALWQKCFVHATKRSTPATRQAAH